MRPSASCACRMVAGSVPVYCGRARIGPNQQGVNRVVAAARAKMDRRSRAIGLAFDTEVTGSTPQFTPLKPGDRGVTQGTSTIRDEMASQQDVFDS